MTPYYSDSLLTFHQGSVIDVLRQIPDKSVQMVCTSPPYWALRSYLPDGHADKCHELGLEATPGEYVAAMVAVFDGVRRVLRDDGTVWLNLGDSFSGGGNGSRDDERWPKQSRNADGFRSVHGKNGSGLASKQMVGIPWRVALALQDAGWYLRSDVIWSKPNPMPESVRDRPTKSHEYIFLLTKNARYFYDSDAVRTPAKPGSRISWQDGWATGDTPHDAISHSKRERRTDKQRGHGRRHAGFNDRWDAMPKPEQQAMGANLRSVWHVATHPYPDAHFATFPPEIPRLCILDGTSERGACSDCGAPWQRVMERHRNGRDWNANNRAGGNRLASTQTQTDQQPDDYRPPTTTDWQPTCDCDAGPPVPCVVMDPFLGSGTTALVAQKFGRKCIGIDLSSDYLDMAIRRTAQKTLWGEVAS